MSRVHRVSAVGLSLLFCALAAIFSVVPAQTGPSDSAELRQMALDVHEIQRNVGLAAAIRVRGETVFSFYLGAADLEHEIPVNEQTRFGIASITKVFTAVTLLKFHAAGEIDLDAPVQKYVPSFPEKAEGEITIRMLATHRSGIPHPRNRTPDLYATHYETATDALAVFADEPLEFPPDSTSVYSSSNYNLLAAVIEEVTGKPFPVVVEQEILEPLELRETGFDNVLRLLPHRARRYSFYHPWTYSESDELWVVPIWDYSFNWGGGNMVSTVRDLVRFGEALTAPGLLPREEYDLLSSEDWFGSTDDEGRRLLYVTGANPGLQAALAVYPEGGIAAAVLSNTWGVGSRSGDMIQLARRLAKSVISN